MKNLITLTMIAVCGLFSLSDAALAGGGGGNDGSDGKQSNRARIRIQNQEGDAQGFLILADGDTFPETADEYADRDLTIRARSTRVTGRLRNGGYTLYTVDQPLLASAIGRTPEVEIEPSDTTSSLPIVLNGEDIVVRISPDGTLFIP